MGSSSVGEDLSMALDSGFVNGDHRDFTISVNERIGMNLVENLKTFVAIADAGSLVGGARRRRVSAPTATRALATLEEHLRARLVVRTTRALRLTDVGEAYLAQARRVLAAVEDAEAMVTGRRARPEGLLSLTAPELFGERYIAPILFEFLDAQPLVTARAIFSNRVVNLVDEGFDVALRIGPLPDSALTAIPLGTMRIVWVASPSYLDRVRAPRSVRDLDAHAFVSLTIEGQEQITWERRRRAERRRPRERLVVNKNSVKVAAAVAGQGIARALAYQVAGEVEDGRLQVVLARHEPPPVPVHLVHPEGRAASAQVREFLAFAAPRLRSLPLLRGEGLEPRPRAERASRRR
ncbi:MAG: LysR family transcriptional regulator [Deltaproteobacteria bacterium]|nr:LysR family transcriptional regulator [Deltaproteobacteria bacterium]